MASNHWVLIANGSRARIVESAEFQELECLVNEEHRAKEMDLVSDRPGRFNDESFGHSSAETHHKELALEDFAHTIATHLESARNDGRLTKLTVIASPKILGALRHSMDAPLKALVAEEFDKDLTDVPTHEIADRLAQLRG